MENIKRQAKKSKNAEWICTESDIKTKLEIKSKPQPLHQWLNPVDIEQVEHHLHLEQNITKGETETETLRHIALETMKTRYPQDKWLHIFTGGS